MGILSVLLVFGGVALYVMTPEERTRLAETLLAPVIQAVRAAMAPPSDPFNDFLRARTRWAIVTPLLVAVNTIMFLLVLFDARPLADPQTLVSWGANFAPRTTNGEWWRLVSAMFVHAGVLHLVATTAALLPLGLILERAVGPIAFVTIYFASGMLANVIGLWATPGVVSGGASGAIFGVYGLLLASLIWSAVRRATILVSWITMKQLGATAAVFFGYNLLTDDLGRACEVAGFTTGAAAGFVLARHITRERTPLRRAAYVLATSVAVVLVCALPMRGMVDVRAEIASLIAIEERTAGSYDTAVVKFRKGSINSVALAELIDSRIMPELQAARVRVRTLRHIPREQTPLVGVVDEYLQLREQSWERRADALVASNTAMLREADRAEQAALEAFRRMKAAG